MCLSHFWLQISLFRHFTSLTYFTVQGLNFPDLFRLSLHLGLCIPRCVCFFPCLGCFLFHLCVFTTLHFTALIPALAMAPDDEPGIVLRPVCTVKRFANRATRTAPYLGSASSSFCPPTPKASGLPTPQLLCRWSQGRFSPDYRPKGLSPVEPVGLFPPLRESRFQSRGVLPTGGWQFVHPLWAFIARAFSL